VNRLRELCIAIAVLDYPELMALARARLARWISPKRKPPVLIQVEATYGVEAAPNATIAEVLAARGYREVKLEMPRTDPEPLPPAEITEERIRYLNHCRGVSKLQGQPEMKICRGPRRGCIGSDQDNCIECYRVQWWDRRSSAEILKAMERGDA
jgi:hypothetical protein